jgi:hypothetical protein
MRRSYHDRLAVKAVWRLGWEHATTKPPAALHVAKRRAEPAPANPELQAGAKRSPAKVVAQRGSGLTLRRSSVGSRAVVHDVILINGPPGVGKSTVSELVARAVSGTVCIHGDALRAFAPLDARKYLGGGSTYRAAAALTLEYLAMGAPRVVFDYCFLAPRHVAYFVDRLGKGGDNVRLFTLWAPLGVVQQRERGRVFREALGAKVEECWSEIASNRAGLGEFVDNGDVDPNVTAQRILNLIDRARRRVEEAAEAIEQ